MTEVGCTGRPPAAPQSSHSPCGLPEQKETSQCCLSASRPGDLIFPCMVEQAKCCLLSFFQDLTHPKYTKNEFLPPQGKIGNGKRSSDGLGGGQGRAFWEVVLCVCMLQWGSQQHDASSCSPQPLQLTLLGSTGS